MKRCLREASRGFNLIELLCVIAIIAVLAALLLPTLSRGKRQASRIRCAVNLRQTGLAFIEFAHQHEDKFPIQVSTNQGGSSEFLDAAHTINGEFYFSYRHFLPLAADLRDPRLLACPADTRIAATNFDTLRNENLSYFAAANPQFGRPDSILAGDRNISPVYGSRAQVGGSRYLRWTHEMHQDKGNVLFADGHVEQLRDVLSLTNTVSGAPAELLVPSVKAPVAPPPVTGDSASIGRGNGDGGVLPKPDDRRIASVSVGSNAVVQSGVVSNFAINSGPPGNPPVGFLSAAVETPGQPTAPPSVRTTSPPAQPMTRVGRPQESNPAAAPGETVAKEARAVPAEPRPDSKSLWWLLLVALLAVVLLLSRRLLRIPRRNEPEDKDELLPH